MVKNTATAAAAGVWLRRDGSPVMTKAQKHQWYLKRAAAGQHHPVLADCDCSRCEGHRDGSHAAHLENMRASQQTPEWDDDPS